jgi:hypothetical protein
MSKHLETPTTRLICFGGARALTNAPSGSKLVEDDIPNFYNP